MLVSYLIDELGVSRVPASVALGTAVFLLGVPVTIDLMFLNLYDLLADGILLVLGSLLLALFVGWVIPDVARDELRKGIADIGGLDDAWDLGGPDPDRDRRARLAVPRNRRLRRLPHRRLRGLAGGAIKIDFPVSPVLTVG